MEINNTLNVDLFDLGRFIVYESHNCCYSLHNGTLDVETEVTTDQVTILVLINERGPEVAQFGGIISSSPI